MQLSDNATEYVPNVLGGIVYPDDVTQHSLDAAQNYKIRDDDIWVCSYPKAGSHWLCEIVQNVLVDGFKEKIDRSKQPSPMSFDRYLDKEPVFERAKRWSSPRILDTHLQEDLLPTELQQGKGKVIYIVRNPKDTAVSYYHFIKPKNALIFGNWEKYLEMYSTNKMRFGTWYTHTLGFWNKWRYRNNFLLLKYEDLKLDTSSAVLKISQFLDHPLDAESVQRVVNSTTIDEMKKTFHAAGETDGAGHKTPTKIGPAHMIRKGLVGDWKSNFTVAQSEAFDRIYEDRMTACDLVLQFELK